MKSSGGAQGAEDWGAGDKRSGEGGEQGKIGPRRVE